MLQASRQLEGYLSQERYGLDRMARNENVSEEFLAVKVDHFNGLVTTLNQLFSSLTGITDPLFVRYGGLDEDEELCEVSLTPYETDTVEAPVAVAPANISTPPSNEAQAEVVEVETPVWQLDGYSSYAEWVTDKESETEESRNDTSVSVSTGLSQHRAGQILNEYNESTEQSIDLYNPEDDTPATVLTDDDAEDEQEREEEEESEPYADRSTRDMRYRSHTIDNQLLDKDPAQITRVETAVEREGVNGSRGPDIDVDSYSYNPVGMDVEGFMDDELEKLRRQSSRG